VQASIGWPDTAAGFATPIAAKTDEPASVAAAIPAKAAFRPNGFRNI
jgi:hypothetical protein